MKELSKQLTVLAKQMMGEATIRKLIPCWLRLKYGVCKLNVTWAEPHHIDQLLQVEEQRETKIKLGVIEKEYQEERMKLLGEE